MKAYYDPTTHMGLTHDGVPIIGGNTTVYFLSFRDLSRGDNTNPIDHPIHGYTDGNQRTYFIFSSRKEGEIAKTFLQQRFKKYSYNDIQEIHDKYGDNTLYTLDPLNNIDPDRPWLRELDKQMMASL